MSDSSQILIEKTENEFNFPTELDGFIHLLILNNHSYCIIVKKENNFVLFVNSRSESSKQFVDILYIYIFIHLK